MHIYLTAEIHFLPSWWKGISLLINSNLLLHFQLFWKVLTIHLHYFFKHFAISRQSAENIWTSSPKLSHKARNDAAYAVGVYLFNVNHRNDSTRYERCSKLTIKTLKRGQWRHSGVFIVNFEHTSNLFLVFA